MRAGSPLGAKYLIRFDDVCPTMNWRVWDEIEPILLSAGAKPIMAVVPDNRDPALVAGPAVPDFWGRVRKWKEHGWCIAMHGYQHLYVTSSGGIIGVNERSEFAGLSSAAQKAKIEQGLRRLRDEGIDSQVWVAPAHSFDKTTLQILKDSGFRAISDGFYTRTVVDDQGLLWVPQQLWRFRAVPLGTWTVCFHVNGWSPCDIEQLKRNLARYRERLVSIDEVLAAKNARLSPADTAFALLYTRLVRLKTSRRTDLA